MCAPFTPILSLLPGKSGRDHTGMWLPTWLHALDTAGVVKRLLLHWLPQSVREGLSQELGEDGAVSFAVLLALLHDIGKMTPLFVSRIAGSLPEIVDRLSSAGLEVPDIKSFRDSAKSPHALAGAAILSDAGFPEVAVQVVFAHHGPIPLISSQSYTSSTILITKTEMKRYGGRFIASGFVFLLIMPDTPARMSCRKMLT